MNQTTKEYNDEFAKIKRKIFDRDSWECIFKENHTCGGMLDIHHIEPRSLGGGNEKENLITVCRSYHGQLHLTALEARRNKCRKILGELYEYQY